MSSEGKLERAVVASFIIAINTFYDFISRVPIIVSLLSVVILLFFVSSLGLSYSSSMSVTDYTNEVIGTIGEYVCKDNLNNTLSIVLYLIYVTSSYRTHHFIHSY